MEHKLKNPNKITNSTIFNAETGADLLTLADQSV